MLSQVGYPSELQNEINYSIPASVNSYSVKVVPSNVSQVESATQSLGTVAAVINLQGTNSNVIFDIPAGQGKSQFIDPRFTTVNFRVNYEVVNNGATAVIASACLRSSAMAHFDRAYMQSQSGILLDDVNLVGVVSDQLNSLEIDVAQRDALALMYGFQYESATSTGVASSANTTQGHRINGLDAIASGSLLVGKNYYSYSMPLLNSLIGKGAAKFFQIGATNKLQLVLQTAAVLPITLAMTSAGTAPTVKVTIDNISLNLQYVDIGADGVKMLNKTGLQYYNGITYRASTSTLPSSAGAVSLLTGLRGSSVRSIFTRCCEASTTTTAGCINYLYDSKLPQATSISYNVNGVIVPPNPVDLLRAPATAFAFTQESNSSFNTYEFKSGLTPDRYCLYVPGGTLAADADKNIVAAGNASSAYNQAQWAFAYNMEKVSKSGIMDGANLNSGNTFLNLVLANGSTATLTFIFIAKMDIIYILDTATGDIQVRM
jgi:hypothetical protein